MDTTTPAILILEDGRSFSGQSFGAPGECFGPAAFVTAMSGYQEILTDEAYDNQVVVATAPHIGNTGWNDEDNHSDHIRVAGYVVRDPSPRPSSWRAKRSLTDELQAQGIVGIAGIDTRALTRHLRDHGPLWAAISTADTDPQSLLSKLRAAANAAASQDNHTTSTGGDHA